MKGTKGSWPVLQQGTQLQKKCEGLDSRGSHHVGGDGENGVNYENIGEPDACRLCQAEERPLFKVALLIARNRCCCLMY